MENEQPFSKLHWTPAEMHMSNDVRSIES
jgi:hypothetical protein